VEVRGWLSNGVGEALQLHPEQGWVERLGEGAGHAFAKRAMRLRIQVQQRHRSIRSSIASMEGRREARGFGSLSL